MIAILNSILIWFAININVNLPNQGADESVLFRNVMTIVTGIIAFISVVAIAYGGFVYMTSGGDPNKIKQGKNTLLYAIIGLIVAISAFAIVSFVMTPLR